MTISTYTQKLMQEQPLVDEVLALNLDGCRIHLQSNSRAFITKLNQYFDDCNVLDINSKQDSSADIQMIAIESAPLDLAIDFIDWAREPGKTGRKDEYFELENARLVRKVRTGMVFLQSESSVIAAGPCIDNDNQVINFINSQYMNWLQNRDWLICHASGLSVAKQGQESCGVAIAGLSGGGKSTLMLDLMNNNVVSYITNDRLFIKKVKKDKTTRMLGIPKLPRINPGTIIGNPKLHSLLDAQQLAHFQSMPTSELWHIEEKHDVSIKQVYGTQRLDSEAALNSFIILNWDRDSEQKTSLELVDLEKNLGLLKAIMKSPGPFYQHTNGEFQKDDEEFDSQAYINNLSDVKIYQASGKIDFTRMSQLILSAII